jgi:acetylornithine/N-succinyldiaminopimelate aminotransferase
MRGFVTNPPLPHNYATELLELVRGRGVHLWDSAGTRYLDLGAGISVNALGYGRRDLARIASRQMRRLIHVSNLYTTGPAVALAADLISLLNGRVGEYAAAQFGNSGAEANEAALKYARLFAHRTRGEGHHKILSFDSGFHGRTMGALSATPNRKYSEPFEPLIPGMESCAYNDVAALENALTAEFAAVIVEVVQGEGGLRVMTREFAEALNTRCAELGVLIIVDEIQTGLGRVGKLFGSELVGLRPDIVTLSKPLAGGLPLSATVIPAKINNLLKPGDHGTTFGGGPVTTAVARYIVRSLSEASFLKRVEARSAQLTETLESMVGPSLGVIERRGTGMLQGLALEGDDGTRVLDVMAKCRESGVLVLKSGANVVRIAPPLVIGEGDLADGLETLKKALG